MAWETFKTWLKTWPFLNRVAESVYEGKTGKKLHDITIWTILFWMIPFGFALWLLNRFGLLKWEWITGLFKKKEENALTYYKGRLGLEIPVEHYTVDYMKGVLHKQQNEQRVANQPAALLGLSAKSVTVDYGESQMLKKSAPPKQSWQPFNKTY